MPNFRLDRIVEADLAAADANLEVFAAFPPGEYVDSEQDNDNSSVQALEEAPNHMRRVSNAAKPIEVDDSDEDTDEREDEDEAVIVDATERLRKRRRFQFESPDDLDEDNDFYIVASPPNHDVAQPAQAGPSQHHPPPPIPADLLLQVLEILPDLCSEFALRSLTIEVEEGPIGRLVGKVVEMALEMVEGYPKAADLRGKQKDKVEPASGTTYRDGEHRKEKRTGGAYWLRSLISLEESFPRMPVPYIREAFYAIGRLYVPAHFRLVQHLEKNPKPYQELKRARASKGKDRRPASSRAGNSQLDPTSSSEMDIGGSQPLDREGEDEFELEKAYLDAYIANTKIEADAAEAKRVAHEEALANGAGIECGCCFGEEVWEEMFQCSEGHLFCRECATRHAETKLGDQSAAILCMDTSGCASSFPESELSRLLDTKSLELYYRLRQAKELEDAGLEGLESCPSCPYAVVIEDLGEKLFRCLNEACGQVTCRKCRRPEHIPMTCEEMEADSKLNNRHVVEDAMSEALIRKCPKCAKPFVKDSGCSKIMCHKCGTASCYICRKAIPEGYAHFDQNPNDYRQPKQKSKCPLWEKDEQIRDNEAIIAARDAARDRVQAHARAVGIDLADEDLNIAAPEARPILPLPHQHIAMVRYGERNVPARLPHMRHLAAGNPAVPPPLHFAFVGGPLANFPAHAVDAGNRPDVNRYRELQRAVQRLNLAPDQRGHDMAALRKQLKQAQQRADEALREQRRANDEFRQAMANFPNGLQHARVGRFDPLLGQLDDRRGGVDEWHVGLQQQPPA